MDELLYKDECFDIIGACYEVHKELGSGFLEQVYQEALEIEFRNKNIPFKREQELEINYKGVILEKKYIADFVCFEKIIVELKSVEKINLFHQSQVINYLKATGFKLGILVNFGNSKLEYKRIVN